MHHLGHTALAVAPPAFRFGALIADGVRPAREAILPPAIKAGVAFHREVDWKTDHHPAFIEARALLRKSLGRYAGVFVDLWLDSVLGENWSRWQKQPLSEFFQALRQAVQSYKAYGPPSWQAFFQALVNSDLLEKFSRYAGMLAHVARFIERRRLPLDPTIVQKALERHHPALEPLLIAFWDEAISWQKAL